MEEAKKNAFVLNIVQDETATNFVITVTAEDVETKYTLGLPSKCTWALAHEIARVFYEEIIRLEDRAILEQLKKNAEASSEKPSEEVAAELVN